MLIRRPGKPGGWRRGGGAAANRLAALALAGALSMPAADMLEGRVWERTGDERRPLPKAVITVAEEGRGPGPTMTRSDAQGRWRVAGPLEGRYYVSVSRPGYYVVDADGAARSQILVDCKSPCGPVEFELMRGGAVNGVVEDDQGEPLQNVNVRLEPESEGDYAAAEDPRRFGGRGPGGFGDFRDGPRPDTRGRTDDLGRFRAAGLRPGRYKVTADAFGRPDAPRYQQFQPQMIAVEAGEETEIRVILQRESVSGFSVSGAVTGVDFASAGRRMLMMMRSNVDGPGPGFRSGRRAAPLSEDGAFDLKGVEPGRYHFSSWLYPERSAPRQIPLGALDIQGDMTGVRLSPAQSVTVAGRFELDTEGKGDPRRAAAMLIPADGSPEVGLQSDSPERTFRQSVLAGVQQLRVRSRDWFLTGVELRGRAVEPDAIPIMADTGDLVIRLSDRFARIEGLVRPAADSERAPRFTVSLSSADGAEVRPTDQNGKFVFERITPGAYKICARPTDALRDTSCAIERTFPVEAGAEIELGLTLP